MDVTRLVIVGAPGAGKTTFVRSIGAIEGSRTVQATPDPLTAGGAAAAMAAFDFDYFTLGSLKVHVYGAPGMARFNFVWEMLAQQADAYMLLVAAHRPESFIHAIAIRNFFAHHWPQLPMAIGVTHLDRDDAFSLEEVMLRLGYCRGALFSQQPCLVRPLVVNVNPPNVRSVNRAVNYLLMSLLMSRRQELTAPRRPPVKLMLSASGVGTPVFS